MGFAVLEQNEIVERIYEAAAVPELWGGRGVLDVLASVSACTDGVIFTVDKQGAVRWMANDSAAPKMEVYSRDNWVAKNPYMETPERIARFREPRFLLDTEVMSVEEMQVTQYYQGFMRPLGMYWHAATTIEGPTNDVVRMSVHRGYDAGPLNPDVAHRLTALRPHLARATLLTARLRFEQVRAAVDAFDLIGLPTAAIKRGRVTLSNKGFGKLVPGVLQDRAARLTFLQASADERWSRLLETGAVARGGTFPIGPSKEFPTMVAHAIPMVGASRDIFSAADQLLVIAPTEAMVGLDPKILEGLFDLTAAEAAVARDLVNGKTIGDIAEARGVSQNTVRVQVKAIFEKTGIHRQADLIRMLLSVRSPFSGAELLAR
ncbi:LuxR family transcriptional regulator [Mesorhizobium sp. M3A.F.Ca.ET.080.04.2.1]|uniref:helix-turn-helix transcriptional regulator n=1 Tax=Mesorhizobium sp. M3A.F.Ca.ET.080.04.2.1 TaxID=2493676 RepID=UPI000F760B3D|nr:LuxR C-terminal-related transcriptional regulator [Mesorhizobium sp. M3A.F.Ca.ET.080.04.2.1]AZO07754.1 LuxR family transcriptional regulator [Mesorhizobium sp. M3A.F.Ca.ET.080.04.2.1]RWF16983.1 MAG: LuxR family transcriptional regulator [Mesorhizobium sp.]